MTTTIGASATRLKLDLDMHLKIIVKDIKLISGKYVQYKLKDGRKVRFLPSYSSETNMEEAVKQYMNIPIINGLLSQIFYDFFHPSATKKHFHSSLNYDYTSDKINAEEFILLYSYTHHYYREGLSIN